MDWVANALICVCWYWYPRRWAVVAGAGGSAIYAWIAWEMSWWGLLAVEILITALQVRAVCITRQTNFGTGSYE